MKKALFFCLFFAAYFSCEAQTRTIKIHKVIVKTENHRHVGILEKVNQNGVFLEKRNQEHIVIPSHEIKTIRIKPSRKTRTIDIPSLEPSITDRNHDCTLTDTYLQNTPSLGDEVGNVIATTVALGTVDAISNSLQSVKKYKINYRQENYFDIIHDLATYSIYFQSYPEYEGEVLRSLPKKQAY